MLRLPIVVCGPAEASIPEPLRAAPGGFAFEGTTRPRGSAPCWPAPARAWTYRSIREDEFDEPLRPVSWVAAPSAARTNGSTRA